MAVMHPWILALVTSSQNKSKMADDVKLTFSKFESQFFYYNMMDLCLQNSFQMNIVNIYTLY